MEQPTQQSRATVRRRSGRRELFASERGRSVGVPHSSRAFRGWGARRHGRAPRNSSVQINRSARPINNLLCVAAWCAAAVINNPLPPARGAGLILSRRVFRGQIVFLSPPGVPWNAATRGRNYFCVCGRPPRTTRGAAHALLLRGATSGRRDSARLCQRGRAILEPVRLGRRRPQAIEQAKDTTKGKGHEQNSSRAATCKPKDRPNHSTIRRNAQLRRSARPINNLLCAAACAAAAINKRHPLSARGAGLILSRRVPVLRR